MSLVELEVRDQVATVTLNDPERRNAIGQSLAAELVAACEEIDGRDDVGSLVIQGAGGFFCSGADRAELGQIAAAPYTDTSRQALNAIYGAFTRVGAVRVPTVAAIRGGAVGAGLNLALAADLRVVSDTAVLRGFHQLRVHPGGGHLGLLARACGPENAAAIALFGQSVTGVRAAEIGLCWTAVPDDQVEAEAGELARAAAEDPWLARAVKASLSAEVGPPALPWTVGLEVERGPQLQSFSRRSAHLAGVSSHPGPQPQKGAAS